MKNFWRAVDVLAILSALLVGGVLIGNQPVPAAYIFSVNQVHISDAIVGQDNAVLYDRTVHKPFWAHWSAKVYRVGGSTVACLGNGRHYYEPTDQLSEITLTWFIDNTCALASGEYFVRTTWDLDNSGIVVNTSNVFQITDGL